jgi:thiol-disulfide isomerase/thioredoxin
MIKRAAIVLAAVTLSFGLTLAPKAFADDMKKDSMSKEKLDVQRLDEEGRGRVVLVDFWTYGCYNCVNTLPYVTKLYETYKDKRFVVVGVHTPEFPFERSAGNVQAALKRHGITYPVAQDNESATWNAWRNQYWPAQYIVDQRGNVVFSHAGEGQYDEIERTVRRLLNATS